MIKKKIFISLASVGAVVASAAMFAAFEAHVINVTAKIENALKVNMDEIDFGTVFPQEELDQEVEIVLSDSFMEEGRVDDVKYMIRQKPKCGVTNLDGTILYKDFGTTTGHIGIDGEIDCGDAPENMDTGSQIWGVLPSLCEYLSKHKAESDPDVDQDENEVDAFHIPYVYDPSSGTVTYTEATGYLSKIEQDVMDIWNIDLKVPCFGDECAQDWEEFVHGINPDANPDDYIANTEDESKVFGCDLWIEVTEVSENEEYTEPEKRHVSLENKDESWAVMGQDLTYGDFEYYTNDDSFHGTVTATGLEVNAKYQVKISGSGGCTATDHALAGLGSSLWESGYWNNGTGLESTCGVPGEGVFVMDIKDNSYTVETDANGEFTFSFDEQMAVGDYEVVKVLVMKILDPYQSPWTDPSTVHTTNLYETGTIAFTID